MRQIPMRDFQLKPTSYLGELPIILTRFGNPIAVVVSPLDAAGILEDRGNIPFTENFNTIANSPVEGVLRQEEVGYQPPTPETKLPPTKKMDREQVWVDHVGEPVYAETSIGYCQGHFDKGKMHKLFRVSYENAGGVIEERFKDKLLCLSCLGKWINMANDSGLIVGS